MTRQTRVQLKKKRLPLSGPMGRPLKVACIGAGYFARFHIEAWQRIKGAALAGVCDLNLSKAEATGAPAFENADEILAATTPDIVDIILPPSAQKAALLLALEAKPKAIICQKPFGTSRQNALEMSEAAEAAGIPLIVHENFRFQPWYRAIKAALDAGHIGTLHQANFRLRPGDGQGPEAYLARQPYFQQMERFLVHETAVHWIDTFRFLLGAPEAVYADLRQMNPVIAGEDAGYILFDHPNGARALFDGNRHLDHAADNHRKTMGEALFEGTNGTLTLQGDGSVHLRRFGETSETMLLGPDTHDSFGGDCVFNLQSHVVDHLTQDTPLENQARDYLAVIEIEEAIYASAQEGRKIQLPSKQSAITC